jgi:hypothetical protein
MTSTASNPLKLKSTTEKILIDCLLIVLVIFIPYHQVAQHTFTDYDDNGYLFQNIHVSHGLTWDGVVWAFTSTEYANWHPLTWISHLIDCELFGKHPGGYLLMNVAWHMLAACLGYLAFLRCTKSRIFALTVALIFALHPVNVENVAWASERKSLLNAVFWFAALIAYLDFIEKRSFKAYGLTAIFFILSLMSKAMSVTLPFTLALIHCLYLVYHPEPPRASPAGLPTFLWPVLRPILPLLVVSIYFSAVTASAQSMAMPPDFPLAARLINSLHSYECYLLMFFHPTELAVFYPLNFDDQMGIRTAVPALLILIALSSAVLLLVRKKPQLLIGWCWFLGTMVPAIGLVQVGEQSHADRYLYIPMLGLAFIFPVLFEMLGSRVTWFRNIAITFSLAVLGVSMELATQIQVSYWSDGVTLCLHSLDVTGFCLNPVLGLCRTYNRTGRFDEFFTFVDSSIVLAKSPFDKAVMATMKANVLYNTGKYQSAMETAERQLDWDFTNKINYAIVALSSYKLGKLDKAAKYLAQAKAATAPSNQSGLLIFPFQSQLDSLELDLKMKVPPRNGQKKAEAKVKRLFYSRELDPENATTIIRTTLASTSLFET